jgi:hypothetical protein
MTTTPPVGYGLFAITMQTTGAPRSEVNVFGFANPTDLNANDCLGNFATALQGSGFPYETSYFASTTSIVERYVLVNRVSVGLQSIVNHTITAGAGSFAAVTPNVSVVVNKTTANAGKRYRGRTSMPGAWLRESSVDSGGNIDPAWVTALQSAWSGVLAQLNTVHVPMVLLHAPGLTPAPAPTLVTALNVSSTVGTQRRRLRR